MLLDQRVFPLHMVLFQVRQIIHTNYNKEPITTSLIGGQTNKKAIAKVVSVKAPSGNKRRPNGVGGWTMQTRMVDYLIVESTHKAKRLVK